MANITDKDKEVIISSYKMILLNLKDYLQKYNVKDELECAKMFFYMLHNGLFSVDKKIIFDNNYDYLALPLEVSQGVQVMYGVCCCRHATGFLYDLFDVFDYTASLVYFFVDKDEGCWRKVNPALEKANHQAILFNSKYILDPANRYILQMKQDGELDLLDSLYLGKSRAYEDDNIEVIGKILKKYYMYRDLGIENVYL